MELLNKVNEEIKEDKVKIYLQEGRPNFQSLGCGVNNGVYYFGTKVWKDKQPYTAIVTSDKKLHINKQKKEGKFFVGIDEIKENFELDYNPENDFYYEGLDNLFTKDAINRWLYGNCNDITFINIYEKLIRLFKRYIYLENETKYKLLALYRISGFFMFVWNARARLFLWAEMGSGKSRFTQLLHNTGFNSVSLGDWTKSYFQRMVQSTMCEVHLDDFESMGDEQKKETERLIKVGYLRGFKAGKTSDNKRKPEVFELFNTTTINNTEGLDVISSDRCYTIRIPKISGTVGDRNFDKEPNFKDQIYKELRDSLYVLGLKECHRVAKVYPTIKSNKINGRLLSIAKPELTIAKLISDELYQEIEKWYCEEIKESDCKDLSNDWEYQAYSGIYERVVNKNQEWFFLSEVIDPLIDLMYTDLYPDQKKKKKLSMSMKLGSTFKRNTIFKKGMTNGRVRYKVGKESFIDFLKAKRLYSQIASTNSTASTNSINSTSSTNNSNKNYLGNYIVEEVVE